MEGCIFTALLLLLQGMACVGRQKVCSVVPMNHFGPIPGVEVGTMWKFRVQVGNAVVCFS